MEADKSVSCMDKKILAWLWSRHVQHVLCMILWQCSSVEHVPELGKSLLYMSAWFFSNMLDLRWSVTWSTRKNCVRALRSCAGNTSLSFWIMCSTVRTLRLFSRNVQSLVEFSHYLTEPYKLSPSRYI